MEVDALGRLAPDLLDALELRDLGPVFCSAAALSSMSFFSAVWRSNIACSSSSLSWHVFRRASAWRSFAAASFKFASAMPSASSLGLTTRDA